MGRVHNRVGVYAGDAEVVHGPSGGDGGSGGRVTPVDDDSSLEQKRLRKQKELLKKKKAERRAHAKQRKQAQVHGEIEGEIGSHVDRSEPPAEASGESKLENRCDATSTEELSTGGENTVVVAMKIEADLEVVDNVNTEPHSTHDYPADEATDHETVAPPLPSTVADQDQKIETSSKHVAEDEQPPPLLTETQPQQQLSSSSLPSETPTLSVDETDTQLHPKKTRKPSPSPDQQRRGDDDHAAAQTIQTAMKTRLLHQTKRTLTKARSLIRQSSKIVVEQTDPVVETPQITRPAIVPPLKLTPQPPLLRSTGSSCSSDDEETHSSASSSRASFSNCTHSRLPSTSSSSSESSSSSRSSSTSSGNASEQSRRKSRSKPFKNSGPSVELLLPRMPTSSVSNGLRGRQYGELHDYMATRIQARVRGMYGRLLAAEREQEFVHEVREEALREVQEEASVRIQALIKGFLVRRRFRTHSENGSIPPKQLRATSAHHHAHGHHRRRSHPHTKSNSIMPQSMASACGGGTELEGEDLTKEEDWPEEFNLEPLDQWEELNSPVVPNGETVTVSQFLSRGKIRVFCGTWNLHATKPRDDLRIWIPSNRYHVVAVGTEECVNSIAKSVVFTSKKQWEDQLKETLGDEYVLVAAHSLTAIHNAVFVHESVLPYVQNIQSDAVATGLGNQLGNKGGVGIAFSIGHTSLAFVNCHFDAHQHNVAKRNANFHRINQELQLVPVKSQQLLMSTASSSPPPEGLGKSSTSRFSSSGSVNPHAAGSGAMAAGSFRRRKLPVSEAFDRVFWFGDLNYRINGTRRMIDLLLLHNHHAVLRFNDQLRIEMHKENVFAHFQEGPLHFRPTYKFDKHSNVYDSGPKQRIPSWTDRILFLSNDKPHDIELLSYRSHMNFLTSDHRPVGAVFQVSFSRGSVQSENKHANKRDDARDSVTGEAQTFARVLAKGYKPNQSRSEVCVIQ